MLPTKKQKEGKLISHGAGDLLLSFGFNSESQVFKVDTSNISTFRTKTKNKVIGQQTTGSKNLKMECSLEKTKVC